MPQPGFNDGRATRVHLADADNAPDKGHESGPKFSLVGAFEAKHMTGCSEAAVKSGVVLSMRPSTPKDTLPLRNLIEPKRIEKRKDGSYGIKGQKKDEPVTPVGSWIIEATGTGTQLGDFRYYLDAILNRIDSAGT